MSNGSGGESSITGKSSSRGLSVFKTSSNDFFGSGSMISLFPSFRMIASSPGNSNSRGMRTARLRPFPLTYAIAYANFCEMSMSQDFNAVRLQEFMAGNDVRCSGSTTANVVPLPTVLVTSMRPW